MRIETQQETMATRDQTIKKLITFLHQHQQQKCREVQLSLEGRGGGEGEGGGSRGVIGGFEGNGEDGGGGERGVEGYSEKDTLIQSLYAQLQGLQDKVWCGVVWCGAV